nr:hypothetical protein [Tanacetum cinerariifolium]
MMPYYACDEDDIDDESDDQELEAHYMYLAQIQEVTPDTADNSRPIFDAEPSQKLVEIILFIIDSGSKDETPAFLIDFLTLVQRGLHAQVRTVRTDKGTEFLIKNIHAYFAKEGIRHETSTAQTPEITVLSKDETMLLLRLLE